VERRVRFEGRRIGTVLLLLIAFKNALWTALRTTFRQKSH